MTYPPGNVLVLANILELSQEQLTVFDKLTPAQKKVLDELVFKGSSNKEIAKKLKISPETVRNHIASIGELFFQKTDNKIKNRTHLALLYQKYTILHKFS